MNTLNPVLVSAKPNNLHNPSLFSQPPLNSFPFKTPLPLSIKLSSSSSPFTNSKTFNSKPFKSLISTTTVTAVLFLTGFYFNPKKAVCAPVERPPTVETNAVSKAEEETEKALEDGVVVSNLNDVEILRNLLEVRVKNRELDDALTIINRLIELEPDENEWRFLKSHLYVHNGEVELAKLGFREVMSKDPYYVEVYRGLVVASLEDEESVGEMKEIEKKFEEGINVCKEEKKESELRDFRLLLAQIWVIEGKYDEALKAYQVLVDEDPGDFRPYLCQGMLYTVLKKNDEAGKCLEKYRELVPQEQPNAKFEFIVSTL